MPRKNTTPPTAPLPASNVQQTEEVLPSYLEPYRQIFALIIRFLKGEKAIAGEITPLITKAREAKEGRGNIDRAIAKLVFGGIPISIISDLYDERSARWLTGRLHDFMECAKAVGLTVNNFSYAEAKHVLELYKKQHPLSAGGDVVFRILNSRGPVATTPFPSLERWVYPPNRVTSSNLVDHLATQRLSLELEAKIAKLSAELTTAKDADNFDEAKRLKTEIATLHQEMASLTTPTTQDEEEIDEGPSLEEQIAVLEAALATAKDADNFDEAKRLKTEIATLRKETTSATPAVVTAVPSTTTLPPATAGKPNGNGAAEFTLDDALEACASTNASEDLQRILARRKGVGKPITDAKFVEMVAALTGNSAIAKSARV